MSGAIQFFAAQIALLAVVLVLHTYIGLHVVRRSLIFSDLVLDQLAALGGMVGVAVAIEYGTIESYFLSLAAVLFGAAALAVFKPKSREVPREAMIGILYAMALAGTLLLGDKITGGAGYVSKTLSGSMLWVTWPIVALTASVYVVLLIFHFIYRRQFIRLAEAEIQSHLEKRWDFLFFTTQGIITVLIVPVAGVLLAYAFLMVPAAIAAMFTRRWGTGVLLGWSIGMVACVSGVFLSYFRDLPYGPTLILCLGAAFMVALMLRATLPSLGRV